MARPQDHPLSSREILDEVTRAHNSRDVVDVEEETVKVVVFTLGQRRYAFPGQDIKEILPDCQVYPVPSLPGYLPGLINVRGEIESAVDLRPFLGGTPSGPGRVMMAMAQRGDFRAGIIIEAVEDVTDLPKSRIKPALATLTGPARDLAAAEVDLGEGQTATLIDLEKLAAMVTL